MRFGLSTPIVTNVPGISGQWEQHSGIEEITRIAQQADRLGYHHVNCSEHVGVPAGGQTPRLPQGRGTRYWDPLATLSWVAARTDRIRLATNVLVLGYHHPLQIAKRYGTLDFMSGGRVVLGLGVGSVREEFDVLGASFDDRGSRADDAMRALRAALSQHQPEYHGLYYDFEGLVVDPCAVQASVPLWVGGHSVRALRRAVTLADGWVPGHLTAERLGSMLAKFPDRRNDFDVVIGAGSNFDAAANPNDAEETIAALANAGATMLMARPHAQSVTQFIEQIEAIANLPSFTPTK